MEQRAKAWLGFWNLSLSSLRGAAVAGPGSLRIFRFHLPADTKASPGVRGRRARTHGCAHTRTTAQRREHLCIHTHTHFPDRLARTAVHTHSHWHAPACTRSCGPAVVGRPAFTLWARTRRAAHGVTHARSHPHAPRPWRRPGRCAARATGGDPGGGGGGDSGGGGAG